MTIRHLTIFSEVCHLNSITKAAERLNMSQPAVSSAIRELETYYQTKLFERMNRRLYLTEPGQYLLQHADSVLAQLDEAKEYLSDIASATQIRIGSNVSFGESHLADVITDFRNAYPDIPVCTTIQNSGHVGDLLLRNQLDFAIADDLSASSCFHQHFLLSEEMVAACSPDCKFLRERTDFREQNDNRLSPSSPIVLKPADLAHIPLLLREMGSGSRTIIDQLLRAYNISATIAAESTSTQVLIEFARCGHGLLLLPRTILSPCFASGSLVPLTISGVSLSRNYYLVFHKSKFFTQSMKRFLAHLTGQTNPPLS